MPEFILEYGSREAAKRFKDLDSFAQGYIEAMFFTETGTADDYDMRHSTISDLSETAWCDVIRDGATFLLSLPKDKHGRTALDRAYDYAPDGYDETCAGRDFWYTRNHHGVGYWDRGFGDIHDAGTIGCELTKAAHAFRETSLYLGDDGLLYLE